MSTRRAILQLIGAAPAAAVSVKGELATMLASPAVAAAMTLAAPMGTDGPGHPGGHLGPLGKQLYKLSRQARDEQEARRASRYSQLDPSIAALRSVSAVNKARLQFERDTEDANLFRRIDEVIYGN